MKRVAVLISGGVDSFAAAHLLAAGGWEVTGLHFVTGYESAENNGTPDVRGAQKRLAPLARRLGISIEALDISSVFQRLVVDYFIQAYARGQTPNPCLVCNPGIKFGLMARSAAHRGASRVATGHYALVKKDAAGRMVLAKGADPLKDQSYFLAFLRPHHLARAVFPLGAMTKKEVATLAGENGWEPLTDRGESQDVCFIPHGCYADFLASRGMAGAPGDIVDESGKKLGTHQGLFRFTVGQRRGINIPASRPYYVKALLPEKNRLVVGFKESVFTDACRVGAMNWIAPAPEKSFRANVRVRFRSQEVPALVTPKGLGGARVVFDAPQAAVTPGQGAVFYEKDRVLGGGFILP